MKSSITKLLLALVIMSVSTGAAVAQDATEIMKKSHMAYYYAGNDGVADVTMTIVDKKGKERLREFTMLRLDEADGGSQKYYTYFKKPSDVSRLTFMVHKNPDGNDARWIYVPSVDLVKPISADDKNSSFVGSDFSYEDVSGRHWTEDNHTLKADSTIDGKTVYVIESIPKEDEPREPYADCGWNGKRKCLVIRLNWKYRDRFPVDIWADWLAHEYSHALDRWDYRSNDLPPHRHAWGVSYADLYTDLFDGAGWLVSKEHSIEL